MSAKVVIVSLLVPRFVISIIGLTHRSGFSENWITGVLIGPLEFGTDNLLRLVNPGLLPSRFFEVIQLVSRV